MKPFRSDSGGPEVRLARLEERLAALTRVVEALVGGAATTAASVTFTPTGGISAVNVQAALAELDSEKALLSHTHTKSQITDFAHTHPQSEITNLVTDLAGKAAASHTHNASDITAGTLGIARMPVAASGTSSTTEVVRADDSRLSDARAPTSHSHPQSDITNLTTDLAAKQPLDATLTALAGVATAADRLPYFTGTDTASVATFTAFARTLLDDASATTARATLGLGSLATLSTITNANISGDAVDNGQLANMPANTIKGNDTGSLDSPKDLTVSEVKALLSYTLNDLADVDTTGATSGSIIKYNGSSWVVGTDNTGSAGYPKGTFTMNTGAATTTVVSDANITTASAIIFIPTNANAASLDGTPTSYTVSTGSMTVTHQASSLSRTFTYLVIN